MAQTKRKRQTKHRGNAAGKVEVRGGNSRQPAPAKGRPGVAKTAEQRRIERMTREPTWRGAMNKAGIASIFFAVFVFLILGESLPYAAGLALVTFAVYVPLSFYTDRFVYNRNIKRLEREKKGGKR